MTEPTRGARARRGNRRPGSLLLTILLVLAIAASSALVFTNKVELLKLAVIISLWAAVVAAFVSFIYRRQADVDQAKSRDLKLVYDLQLDREISARREYELAVEAHLRRELASEMRAQSSDEVASLRAELAALRANLEIIFDTDLQHRPAIENERTTVHTFGDWGEAPPAVAAPERVDRGPGRVISSRIDTEMAQDSDPNTEESPIIDVPVEPHPPVDEWAPPVPGGAHRRPSEPEPADNGWRPPPAAAVQPPEEPRREGRRRAPEPEPTPPAPPPPLRAQPAFAPSPPVDPQPVTPPPIMPPPVMPPPVMPPTVASPPPRPEPVAPAANTDWRPAPAEGHFLPAGAPGSNWTAPTAESLADERPVPAPPPLGSPVTPPAPEMTAPPLEPNRSGRHTGAADAAEATARAREEARRARHSAPSDVDPGRPPPSPTLAQPPLPPPPEPTEPSARHREPDEVEEPPGQHIGGQPVSELMARLQVGSTGGGRRRRRDE